MFVTAAGANSKTATAKGTDTIASANEARASTSDAALEASPEAPTRTVSGTHLVEWNLS